MTAISDADYGRIISKNLKRIMYDHQKTQADISHDLSISKATVSSWVNGSRIPRMDKIDLLCHYFNVTRYDIMEDHSDASSLPPGAIPLGRYRIPIVAVVAAGVPIYSEDNIVGYVDYDRDPHGEVFALRVKGDSMVPKIENGDLVIVDKSVSWEDNDIVIVRVNGHEGTCKRVKRYAEGISLISINPAYEPMYYSREQVEQLPVEVVGRVMEVRSRL